MKKIKHFQLSLMVEGRGGDDAIVYRMPAGASAVSVSDGVMTFPYIIDESLQGVAGFPIGRVLFYSIIPVIEDIA